MCEVLGVTSVPACGAGCVHPSSTEGPALDLRDGEWPSVTVCHFLPPGTSLGRKGKPRRG